MQQSFVDINTIGGLHKLYGCDPPQHPLVSFLQLQEISRDNFPEKETAFRLGFYAVYLKQLKGSMGYGRSVYDFDQGTLVFTAPGQAVTTQRYLSYDEGWGLFFHPDLLYRTDLGKKMHAYSFFQYDANEALHLSEGEKKTLRQCAENVRTEYSQNIDKHSQQLIVNNLELLLNYCTRFYDRQFFTRSKPSQDIVQSFEQLLVEYFSKDSLIEDGLPDVKYFALRLNLSSDYLSDLLNRYTGKSTIEHIHLQLVDKAKSMLWGTGKNISEIAYDLGFEHPSHFTKVFKHKTGKTPSEFRQLN
ncbi:Helix-turn-helix domain-containing protein [Dyadobacter sp. SG02]|uniref:helix-turn-helix domain-containing protein n=1 Tax=Dyadobacter sp. SG02 TaxID=1855291 RepID=UPI0008D3DF37|nr:helix-turn-helix domain-containing protein [Dyadobacter sp. SG02]SEJ15795.1 Helix-turn-helix domain-containing protein [Dyadobacter sp. SG02]